jgi:hypothetical protein
VGGVCAVLALATVLFTQNSGKQVAPAEAKPVPSAVAAAQTEAPPPAVDLSALPVEPATSAPDAAPGADQDVRGNDAPRKAGTPAKRPLSAPAPVAAAGAAPAPVKSAAPAKPAWKHDPGF